MPGKLFHTIEFVKRMSLVSISSAAALPLVVLSAIVQLINSALLSWQTIVLASDVVPKVWFPMIKQLIIVGLLDLTINGIAWLVGVPGQYKAGQQTTRLFVVNKTDKGSSLITLDHRKAMVVEIITY